MQTISEIITEIQEVNKAYVTLQQKGIQSTHLKPVLRDLIGELASAMVIEVVTGHGEVTAIQSASEIITEIQEVNKAYVTLQQKGIQSESLRTCLRNLTRKLACVIDGKADTGQSTNFGITEHKPFTTSSRDTSVKSTSKISEQPAPTSNPAALIQLTSDTAKEPAPSSTHKALVEPASVTSPEPARTSADGALVEPAPNIANDPVTTAKHKAATGVTKEGQVMPKTSQGAANAEKAWSDMQERGWRKPKISWANLMLWDLCFGNICHPDRHSYEVVCSMLDREMLRMSQPSNDPFD